MCFNDYCNEWKFLKEANKQFKIGIFTIQKYIKEGHYLGAHAERIGRGTNHRYFAFMTYLNNVKDGGETVFPNYNISIKPKKGLTLIWPSDWTHYHYAEKLKAREKYIISGWIELIN